MMSTEKSTESHQEYVRAAQYVRMSTDHQRYSLANQAALIGAYARTHGMQVVQSYADSGRSGLTIRDRPGLSRMLADIVSGAAEFELVLVYDVSRWGRFQDADESAHYEFLCRRAGIRVIYCAEQFGTENTPFSGVLKALKRAMAGEYSRELSTKVAAGKARIGGLGYRVGGIAGYGLRRQVLEDGKTPGIVLRDHQRKSIQTDRVTLVPGPEHEIALVCRIYRDYIYLRRSERQIAKDLNAQGHTFSGRAWSRNLVRTVLSNEKYVGNNIVGQFCQRLRTRQVVNPPETWTRCDGAFAPIVSRELFEAAARVRRFNEKTYITREEIVRAVRVVLRREGKLTAAIINAAPELPSANTIEARFGSLVELYSVIGYQPPAQYEFHVINRQLQLVKKSVEASLVEALRAQGFESCIEDGLVRVAEGRTAEVLICRYQQPRPYRGGWRVAYQRNEGGSVLVAARMTAGNGTVRDYVVVPRSAIRDLPLLIQTTHDALLAPHLHKTIESVAQTLLTSV